MDNCIYISPKELFLHTYISPRERRDGNRLRMFGTMWEHVLAGHNDAMSEGSCAWRCLAQLGSGGAVGDRLGAFEDRMGPSMDCMLPTTYDTPNGMATLPGRLT